MRAYYIVLQRLRSRTASNIQMRADAPVAAGNLLAVANQDLIAAKSAGDHNALRTMRIIASSGYRSPDNQAQLWRKYFTGYYNQTAVARAKLPGGPHSDEATTGERGQVLQSSTQRRWKVETSVHVWMQGLTP